MPSKMSFEGQLVPFVSFDLTRKKIVTDRRCLVESKKYDINESSV